jgi:anti-anti-sigma factor
VRLADIRNNQWSGFLSESASSRERRYFTVLARFVFAKKRRKFSRAAIQLLSSSRHVILEFSDIRNIDSAGIGELVLVQMQAQAFECSIRLAAATPQVQSLLELTNVASLFEIYPTLEAALASPRV